MELCKYPKTGNVRTFHIEAIQIPIVYNKYGDYDPNGLLYVLEEDAERIKREALQRFEMEIPQPYKEVRPLVIRVNLGDTVKIRFRNSLSRRLSIHVQGLIFDVNTSDGSSVGYNADSTTSGEIWYTWYADTEGVFLFNDMADPRSTEDATNIHGLFGAIIVEAPEAKWFDPETGEELASGLMADIYQPGKPAFREYSVFFHDELEVLNKEGEQPIDPHTGLASMTTTISYRSEPRRNRMPHSHDPADPWRGEGDPCISSPQPSMETEAGQSGFYDHRFHHYKSAGMLYTGYFIRGREPEQGNRGCDIPLSSLSAFYGGNVDLVEDL